MANPFVHVELNSNDVKKARPFYAALFGWELSDMEMGDAGTYTMIGVGDDGTGGGMMQHPMPGAPSVWVPYVSVDDLAASTEKAKTLGGTVIQAMVPPSVFAFSVDAARSSTETYGTQTDGAPGMGCCIIPPPVPSSPTPIIVYVPASPISMSLSSHPNSAA